MNTGPLRPSLLTFAGDLPGYPLELNFNQNLNREPWSATLHILNSVELNVNPVFCTLKARRLGPAPCTKGQVECEISVFECMSCKRPAEHPRLYYRPQMVGLATEGNRWRGNTRTRMPSSGRFGTAPDHRGAVELGDPSLWESAMTRHSFVRSPATRSSSHATGSSKGHTSCQRSIRRMPWVGSAWPERSVI